MTFTIQREFYTPNYSTEDARYPSSRCEYPVDSVDESLLLFHKSKDKFSLRKKVI